MSSKIRSESIVEKYTIMGRWFDVTETLWAEGGASYDVTDSETGFALHDESYDTIPTETVVADLIPRLVVAINTGIWPAGDETFFNRAEVVAFLESFEHLVRVSLDVENRYENYEQADQTFTDVIITRPPNWSVDWFIVTGIDGSTMSTDTAHVYAIDTDGARLAAIAEALLDQHFDPRISPSVRTGEPQPLDVTQLDGDDEAWQDWAATQIEQQFTGVGHTDGDSWYDVEITDSSDPALIGKTFAWGY